MNRKGEVYNVNDHKIVVSALGERPIVLLSQQTTHLWPNSFSLTFEFIKKGEF